MHQDSTFSMYRTCTRTPLSCRYDGFRRIRDLTSIIRSHLGPKNGVHRELPRGSPGREPPSFACSGGFPPEMCRSALVDLELLQPEFTRATPRLIAQLYGRKIVVGRHIFLVH